MGRAQAVEEVQEGQPCAQSIRVRHGGKVMRLLNARGAQHGPACGGQGGPSDHEVDGVHLELPLSSEQPHRAVGVVFGTHDMGFQRLNPI